MFKIVKIENSMYYIDRAIKIMEDYASKEKEHINKRFEKSLGFKGKSNEEILLDKRKDLELQKIRYLNESINRSLKKVVSTFPKFIKIDDVYIQLINTYEVDVTKIENALKKINQIVNQTDEFTQNFEHKIKRARTGKTIGFLMGKYLGKVNSMFKKSNSYFEDLEKARKFMNKLPNFEDLYTVSIAGFPNVGKSTLMKKITGSDVEIQNYPFTTKGLMFGYITDMNKKIIQMIDTPGLLGRSKRNGIEERAEIIVNNFCDKIIFTIDFTESCGYNIESQLTLLKKVKETSTKNVMIYLSKTDIYDEDSEYRIEEFGSKLKKFKQFKDHIELKKFLVEDYKKTLSKFDPSKLKLIK